MSEYEKHFNRECTYLNAFKRNVFRAPNSNALTCSTRDMTWTYRELDEEANKLAWALVDAGMVRTDVLMSMLYNTPEFVFCWIGCQKAGVVFSPINFRLAPGEVARHIDDSEPKIFMFDGALSETAKEAVDMANHKPEILIMVDEGEKAPGAVDYREFCGKKSTEDIRPPDMGPMDEICRLYTSGTTGEPKGVPMNNMVNLFKSYDVCMHFPLTPHDKTMNMTPWFHSGGLHCGLSPTLHAGAEAVALKAFNPKHVLDHVEKYGLTFLIGAPVTLELLTQVQRNNPRDISSIKGIVTMGAPLEKDACIRYHKTLTPNIFNGYGTTETFWNTFLRPWDLPHKAGTAGRSATDDEVRVVAMPEDKERAEPDDMVPRDNRTEGEIIVKTLKAAFEYYNKPEATRKNYYKGWYYTKDIGTWDEEGYVTVAGRRDDMIVCMGENIHPAQVEAVINEHPKVADNVVVGVPDKVKGQVLAAYVVPAEGEEIEAGELHSFLAESKNLARFKRPRLYKFVGSLPMTATGKKKHFEASKWAKEDAGEGAFTEV